MRNLIRLSIAAVLLLMVSIPGVCQIAAPGTERPLVPAGTGGVAPPAGVVTEGALRELVAAPPVQALLAFRDSDVKFSVTRLMEILSDKRHEGWVLAAYPDPKTSQPLIGAGFSLDLPARNHPQRDLLNPNPFFEPSSAELWQAAGLDGARLAQILNEFRAQLATLTARRFRRNIRNLDPQISEEDANKLLRIAIVQSIVNARAYCRNFDQLTASQQMALTQLVYQMGVNLEQFTQFLALINHDEISGDETQGVLERTAGTGTAYWKSVQKSLMQSQWARLYRARAVAVIAMLDPNYVESPGAAERRVSAALRPAVIHRKRSRAVASTKLASSDSTRSRPHRGKAARRSGKKTA
jgi:hypothetical protein